MEELKKQLEAVTAERDALSKCVDNARGIIDSVVKVGQPIDSLTGMVYTELMNASIKITSRR